MAVNLDQTQGKILTPIVVVISKYWIFWWTTATESRNKPFVSLEILITRLTGHAFHRCVNIKWTCDNHRWLAHHSFEPNNWLLSNFYCNDFDCWAFRYDVFWPWKYHGCTRHKSNTTYSLTPLWWVESDS